MALQCKQSQDIVKYTQVPIFSKSRTDLYVFTTLNSNLRQGTFAETQAGDYRLVLQGELGLGLCPVSEPWQAEGPSIVSNSPRLAWALWPGQQHSLVLSAV